MRRRKPAPVRGTRELATAKGRFAGGATARPAGEAMVRAGDVRLTIQTGNTGGVVGIEW